MYNIHRKVYCKLTEKLIFGNVGENVGQRDYVRRGRVIVKVLPFPGELSAVMPPAIGFGDCVSRNER